MKNAQEKSPGLLSQWIQRASMSPELSNTNNSIAPNSVPSTSRRIVFSSGLNHIIQEKDKLGTTKKRNRRRERNRKNKFDQQLQATVSTSSTPPSSPSTSNPKVTTHDKTSTPVSKTAEIKKIGARNHDILPWRAARSSPRKEEKYLQFEKSLENPLFIGKNTEQKYTFEINRVKRPQDSYLFRKRSSKHKYINLKTFVGASRTCIFKTKIKNWKLGVAGNRKQRKYFTRDETGRQRVHSDSSSVSTGDSSLAEDSSYGKESSKKTRNGKSVNESGSLVEDRSVQVKQESSQASQTSTPKKVRIPKKEKRRQNKLLKKEAKAAQEKFPEYITELEAKNGLKDGQLIRGFLRVNPKSSRNSYVSNENTSLPDYFITSVADRNRALDGDEVVLMVKPEAEWQEGKQTATVVYILEKVHPRSTVGLLKPIAGSTELAVFHPRDKRMPVIHIPSISWPRGFKANPKLYQNILFVARLLEWQEPHMALGVITEALGLSGHLRVETISILKECCLDVTPFSPEMLQYLPKSKEIPPTEFEYREDIRKECVFTIDPLTARDLDDAVSIKELPNGNYEIGVHISDASYYLSEGTVLDKMVREKATTIYLVDNVYHMLPVELCLHCSLLPGKDKLAFSVFWEISGDGEIFDTRFARTILNSCTQLAYEHAQQMIDNPEKTFTADELPKIYNGFTSQDISRTVNILKKISVTLREARMRNGSLRIDQVKLLFSLNPMTGEPLDFIIYENKESHRLIEEFMLLANISVAKKISESFPDIAFLRCHEPPKATMLLEAQKSLETCGIHIDVSSSGSIHSSLRKYITDDYQGFCRGIVLNHIFAKPMTRARYFCASSMDSETDYAHFALSVPIYTHFTSPIRRYADIMVHRLLAASLGYADKPNWEIDQVCHVAANCNKQKYDAKRAGEASSDLYLAHYIEQNQPYIQECVVVDVKDRSFDAIVLKTGSSVRVYQKSCDDNPTWKVETIPTSTASKGRKEEHDKKVLRLTIKFPKTKYYPEAQTMIVEMFSVVNVKLKRVPNTYKLEACLLRPLVPRTFYRTTSGTSTSQ